MGAARGAEGTSPPAVALPGWPCPQLTLPPQPTLCHPLCLPAVGLSLLCIPGHRAPSCCCPLGGLSPHGDPRPNGDPGADTERRQRTAATASQLRAPGAARASTGGAHARPAPAPRRVGRRRPRSASRLAVLLLRKTLGVSPVPSPQGHSLFHRAFLKSEALLSSLKMLLTHFCLCKPTFFLSIYLFIFNL